MTRDILVSRQCVVGSDGYFRPGVGTADKGAVIVRIDFYRPEPDPEMDPDKFPVYRCDYEIKYGDEVVHSYSEEGMDAIGALLRAMVYASRSFDGPYFNAIDGAKKYRDVIPYMPAIPPEWFHDMRIAGTEPTWIADEPVIFLHADGRRVAGRIALGYPLRAAGPYRASCHTLLDGLDTHYGVTLEADTPFQALQLAMASLATRLRAFLASGGRVLKPDGDGEVDLDAIFGPLLADPPPPPTTE